jgi:hypothetical protein
MTLPGLRANQLRTAWPPLKLKTGGGVQFRGKYDPAPDTTPAANTRSFRHRCDELGDGIDDGLLVAGRRSFHLFLHCFSRLIQRRIGGRGDAESPLESTKPG